MEIRFITTEEGEYTPKKMNEYMNDLRGKIQSILQHNYLLESLKMK